MKLYTLKTLLWGRPTMWVKKHPQRTPVSLFTYESVVATHYALEAWERMSSGGVVVEPGRCEELEKIGLVRRLLENGVAAMQREQDAVFDKYEREIFES